jgi:hypothetical protein
MSYKVTTVGMISIQRRPSSEAAIYFCGQSYILLMLEDKHRGPSDVVIKKARTSSRLGVLTI